MKLSIIIPVYNEAHCLSEKIDTLAALPSTNVEVVMVDGGSTDNTSILLQEAGLRVIQSAKGRALQMNQGAAVASGDVLLFLHVDTCLPANYFEAIEHALKNNDKLWGRFDVNIAGQLWMFPVISAFINWRSSQFGIATGDQAIFVKRIYFETLGGFPEQPLMEDVEFSKRLKSISLPVCLKEKVITSGRRWEARGVWRTIFLMWRLRWLYWRGTDAKTLARMYQ